MAIVHVMKGVVPAGGIAFSPSSVASTSITVPGNTGALDGTFNAMRVTAVDTAAWTSWGDPAADPRVYLPLGGSIDFAGSFAGKTLSAKAYP